MRSDMQAELNILARQRGETFSSILLFAIIFFIAGGIYWASQSEIDKVTRGEGRVVPASRIQVVQSLEGGIISELNVREGDAVKAGQTLVVLDDTLLRSQLGETDARRYALSAQIARLEAEISGKEPAFSDELKERYPSYITNELAVLNARRAELNATIQVIEQQATQKKAEISELKQSISQLKDAVKLVKQELDLVAPLVERGVQPQVALIRLRRELNDAEGDLRTRQESLKKAQAALVETTRKKEEQTAIAATRAQEELAKAQSDLQSATEVAAGDTDRVKRSNLTAPTNGVITNLRVSTIGQVVSPGEAILEIVPSDETLLIEVHIAPSDIAFLRPGLKAKVRVSAYDFAIYGSLNATVETIGADTYQDEDRSQYYKVWVRTEDTLRGPDKEPVAIIPGMVATVDIIVGENTILGYFLKPILRARETALREP